MVLDTREEHAKVAYQFRGIINELFLNDLKKKTHRGQMGQVLRGFTMGGLGYGYKSVPVGTPKYDKKGRLRADGFKAEIVPEEARIIQRIYDSFVKGKSINKIAQELNKEQIPTRKNLRGGWNVSTITRILKNEKYTGKYTWNQRSHLKDPLSGMKKSILRPKEEWITQDKPEMKIISPALWEGVQKRWTEIADAHPEKKDQGGFGKKQRKTYSPRLQRSGLFTKSANFRIC